MREHVFTMTGNWRGGIKGSGEISLRVPEGQLSVPAELNGQGIGTNPEELVLAAAQSCYMISLASILHYRKIPFYEIRIRSEAVFRLELSPTLKTLRHYPEVSLGTQETTHKQMVQECFQLAEKVCMVSNALRGNVQVEVQGAVVEA